MSRTYTWDFPLPRTHTGMLLGNGTTGVMIWGEGSVLRVTVGRADFWDHRGGIHWTEAISFPRIRTMLEAGDDAGLGDMFGAPAQGEGATELAHRAAIGPRGLRFRRRRGTGLR